MKSILYLGIPLGFAICLLASGCQTAKPAENIGATASAESQVAETSTELQAAETSPKTTAKQIAAMLQAGDALYYQLSRPLGAALHSQDNKNTWLLILGVASAGIAGTEAAVVGISPDQNTKTYVGVGFGAGSGLISAIISVMSQLHRDQDFVKAINSARSKWEEARTNVSVKIPGSWDSFISDYNDFGKSIDDLTATYSDLLPADLKHLPNPSTLG